MPITGYPAIEHSLDPESGKVELTAHREFRGDDAEPDRIYEFVNGEYVWKNRAADAAELHRLADQAFGNRQYDSAAGTSKKPRNWIRRALNMRMTQVLRAISSANMNSLSPSPG